MKTFDEICIEFRADKGSVHPSAHNYACHYQNVFESLREKPIKILEIGVEKGESAQAWLEFFPLAEVYGVDNNVEENEWNTPGKRGRYTFVRGDQARRVFWSDFKAAHGKDFDIIIDGGHHYAQYVIGNWNNLWDAVKPGGFYCVENLGWFHIEFFKKRVDDLYLEPGIDSLRFCKQLVIIKMFCGISPWSLRGWWQQNEL